jgi:hypothetical protein
MIHRVFEVEICVISGSQPYRDVLGGLCGLSSHARTIQHLNLSDCRARDRES